ncbi:MAG TPA: hypothetical protein VGM82_10180 [Gemmatimonadaceae bacterium]|jgi:hypothetical protein
MRNLVKVLLMLARLLVAVQVILGLLIWFGTISVTQIHIALGSIFVLDVWVLAIIALFALSARGLSLFSLLLGGIIMWLGVAQRTMLLGPMHWAVRVVHLLLGVSAMALIEPLSKALLAHYSDRDATGSR